MKHVQSRVEGPLIAVPHWRAPTKERTQHYYDSLAIAGARHVTVDGDTLPPEARGLLLTGGVDVDPRLYAEKPGPKTDRPNRERDAHEMTLLRQALERDLPVLAICRGHQLLNVTLGGSILQDIPGAAHKWLDDEHISSNYHEVQLDGGRLAGIYRPGATLRVNSRHHQGVTADRLAPTLRPLARAPDGFIEAAESKDHRWVLGIQWHPERPEMRPDAEPLFRAFVEACG